MVEKSMWLPPELTDHQLAMLLAVTVYSFSQHMLAVRN
jgi:hypothetical protein